MVFRREKNQERTTHLIDIVREWMDDKSADSHGAQRQRLTRRRHPIPSFLVAPHNRHKDYLAALAVLLVFAVSSRDRRRYYCILGRNHRRSPGRILPSSSL
jgi:hypothetical protein